jgi:dihydroorotase
MAVKTGFTDMAERYLKFKGFRDVHVHFRDPGMPAAETRATGAAAAAAGGFVCVTTMPNTTPAGDSVAWIREQIEDVSLPVRIAPSACISKGRMGQEIADLERLAEAGAVAFTDDGSFVNDENLMREAMRRAAALGRPVMQHAVVPSIIGAGVIRDCAVARRYNLPVMPPEAETEAVRRDIRLCRDTGCALHIQHISCAGTVEQIRAAQKEGLPVTGEATPHHILFSCDDIPGNDANWKMAPPLGNSADRAAIRAAVKDGTLGMFATDHAPHPAASKAGGFIGTANGIIGLEVAVAITYHVMVEQEGMDVDEWAKRWTEGPAHLIGEEPDGETVIDLQANREVSEATFKSLSRNMPYAGLKFSAWPLPADLLGPQSAMRSAR